MTFPIRLLLLASCLPLLTQCETLETESGESTGGGTVTVVGTIFYPDEVNTTYIVPEGAQIIGAGGTKCRYLVEQGGSMTAHSGQENIYMIRAGGHFRGFTHPATNCKVNFEPGATIEAEQAGPGTAFVPQ